jgi:predicted house-cleaning noncanonical NTP pyrophosphatase (MazG superfamily)
VKLIRDRLPEIIQADLGACIHHIATPTEHRRYLAAKLVEETAEAITAALGHGSRNVLAGELADVLDVVHALAAAHGISSTDLEQARTVKLQEHGGFTRGVIWHDA